jgi:predicted DNA binding protein
MDRTTGNGPIARRRTIAAAHRVTTEPTERRFDRKAGATINEIGTYDRRGGTPAGTLTDRQLAAASTALHLGYYEVPREGTLNDVADELGCAESTASVLLRRAERDILTHVLGRYGGER